MNIELSIPRDPALFTTFTEEEWRVLGTRDWPHFSIEWTAKEAALKALSLGLAELGDLRIERRAGSTIALAHADRHVITTLLPHPHVTCAMAQERLQR